MRSRRASPSASKRQRRRDRRTRTRRGARRRFRRYQLRDPARAPPRPPALVPALRARHRPPTRATSRAPARQPARDRARPSDRRLIGEPGTRPARRCPFCEEATPRGYETGTPARARRDTRGHGGHIAKRRFAGQTRSPMPGRARRYRPRTSMVRRGSTVRVRQRALKRPANGLFCCLDGVRTSLERPSTCPQNLSPPLQDPWSFGLSEGV
jgi:hypothetical protein